MCLKPEENVVVWLAIECCDTEPFDAHSEVVRHGVAQDAIQGLGKEGREDLENSRVERWHAARLSSADLRLPDVPYP